MRLGKVYITSQYTVDLDNESMVDEAKECIYEDIMNAVKYNELQSCIAIIEDASLSEVDIPDFLIDSKKEKEEAVVEVNNRIKWWGYLHKEGTLHVKPYLGPEDISEAHESPFVWAVAGPWECADRDEALVKLKAEVKGL